MLRPQCSIRAMQTAPSVCDVLYGYQPPSPSSSQSTSQPSASPRPATPPVTVTDLASFRPQAPAHAMEPDGWSVVGLPTNFIAQAEPHTVRGTLFGIPAEVRFTPTTYHWRYGDGDTLNTPHAGATWSRLGVSEFSETVTSHAYAAAGTYTVQLSVHHSPEYRLAGGSWRKIDGTIPVAAPALIVRVYTAKTALVDAPCGGSATATGGC